MSLDNNHSPIDVEQIFAIAQQLDVADRQVLAHRLLHIDSEPTQAPKEHTLLTLLQSWKPLEEDFPDIDENLLELDAVNI
jgi:hypothetical protein